MVRILIDVKSCGACWVSPSSESCFIVEIEV